MRKTSFVVDIQAIKSKIFLDAFALNDIQISLNINYDAMKLLISGLTHIDT